MTQDELKRHLLDLVDFYQDSAAMVDEDLVKDLRFAIDDVCDPCHKKCTSI